MGELNLSNCNLSCYCFTFHRRAPRAIVPSVGWSVGVAIQECHQVYGRDEYLAGSVSP